MLTRVEKYTLASEAYRKAGAAFSDIATLSACQELVTFMGSQEWCIALELLKQSDRSITLSRTTEIPSGRVKSYVLTGLGFYEFFEENGDVSYKKEFLKDKIFATSEKQISLVTSFRGYRGGWRLVDFILSELDKIADECPKL